MVQIAKSRELRTTDAIIGRWPIDRAGNAQFSPSETMEYLGT